MSSGTSSISTSPHNPLAGAIELREVVLSAEISVDYPAKPGALRNVSVEVFGGEIFGLIGQSGSGKSTLAHAILRLLDTAGARISGRISLLGHDVMKATERQLRDIRGRQVSLVPQSPAAALNPALRIGTQVREAWKAHSREPWSDQQPRVMDLLASAGLPATPEFLRRFPREISVGQAQRILVVMALLHSPALVLADEPTSAVDVITQKDVLDMIVRMSAKGTSMLLISHDLPAVAALCQRIAILHEGIIVECGPVGQVLTSPAHPYTRKLIQAVPKWS
jgi:ABC-type glutathione transport system ATPase component